MAVINTGLLTRDLNAAFFQRYRQQTEITNHWQMLCTMISSNQDGEDYKWLGTVPQMREWGTGRKARGLHSESYSVKNLKYEVTIEVDRDEISDDRTGQIRIRTQELAQRAAQHKDIMLGALIANGSTTGFNSYDGVPFFDASHSSGLSGTQANEGNFDVSTVAGANLFDEPADTSLWGPQTALAAFNAAVSAMMLLKDDQGEYMHRVPSGFVVACHSTKLYTFMRAFNSALMPQIGSNVLPPGAPPQVISLPEISSPTTFYVFKTDGVVRPFIFQDREPLEFGAIEKGSEEEFMREKYYFGVRARYRLTYGQWQNAYAITMV